MSEARRGILILDFGSQVTQLIARRIRELGVFSEIEPFSLSLEEIRRREPFGIILSGGPSSLYESGAPQRKDVREILEICPVLGICYGMQLLAHELGGMVEPGDEREYGRTKISWQANAKRLTAHCHMPAQSLVWMSHGDRVKKIPPKAQLWAQSDQALPAVIYGPKENSQHEYLAYQFHPEVVHTEKGTELLEFFVFELAHAARLWQGQALRDHLIERIQEQVGPDNHVLCALSGGVDSTVTAALLTKALGRARVHCCFVNTGLLRLGEAEQVMGAYQSLDLDVRRVDAAKIFLTALRGVSDPEQKRKIIGRTFIEVFERETKPMGCQFLAQGTLYPDVIESVSIRGQSVTIKSHHNVGGLPEKMHLKLVEPLRELFKDEVRRIGLELGVDPALIGRHPFPGPGLAIRMLGVVDEEAIGILQKADHIFISELRSHGLYDHIWQAFVALLPVRTVGVMGDGRTYDRVCVLRAVTSVDGMTADWYPFEHQFLARVSNRITNEVKGINRVVYDVSSKPPATIEWE